MKVESQKHYMTKVCGHLLVENLRIRPGSQSAFQFIPKLFDGVEVRALCRLVKFFHTDLNKQFLYGPRFVHRGIVMLKQERAFPNLLPQSWKHRIV